MKVLGYLPIMGLAALMACSSPVDEPPPTPLSPEAQEARFDGCAREHTKLSEAGLIVHGGAKPGVDPARWEKLSDAEKDHLFEVFACVGSAGQVGEREVSVVSAGLDMVLETRKVRNVMIFDERGVGHE